MASDFTWPTPKQLVNNTTAVVVIVLITAIIVFALDLIFENLNKYGVDKLKAIVSNNQVIEQGTNETENTSNTVVEDVNSTSEENVEATDNTSNTSAENSNTTE